MTLRRLITTREPAVSALRQIKDAVEGVCSLVSVVIPCYNYGTYVEEAVSSVLAQTYPHCEIIVIDDGSTDPHTREVLDRIEHNRVRVIHQENQGLALARNRGASVANGEYLVFLDADDRLSETAIALLLFALLHHPEAAYAYPDQRFFGDCELVWETQDYNAYDLLWANHPSVCSMLRAPAFAASRKFIPNGGYEDWEFWIHSILEGHYGVRIPVPVFEYRRHGKTMIHEALKNRETLIRTILDLNQPLYTPESSTALKKRWKPSVSVVIPFYNNPRFLQETLASLGGQTIQDFETIVVDDHSTDPESLSMLESVAAQPGIRLIRREQNGGLPAARNTGALEATSSYLLFLDPDDLLDKTALEKLVLMAAFHPEHAFYYSGVVHFGDINAVCFDPFDAERLRRENFLTSTCLIRRRMYLALGGMDESLRDSYEDYDFWLRLIDKGQTGRLFAEPLFHYRRHEAGESTQLARRLRVTRVQLMESVALRHANGKNATDLRLKSLNQQCLEADRVLSQVGEAYRCEVLQDIRYESGHREELPNVFPEDRWKPGGINVLYLMPSFWLGGAERFDLQALDCLAADGFRVTLVAAEDPTGPLYEEFRRRVYELHSIRRYELDHDQELRFLEYLLVSKNIDVVFVRNSFRGYELAKEWRKVTRQVRFVDLVHLHVFGKDWVRLAAPFHDCLDKRYVVTEDLKDYSVRTYNLTPDRFEVLYYGLGPAEIPERSFLEAARREIRTKFGISQDAPVVGFVGRVSHQKNPVRWLNVAEEIGRMIPNAAFLLVGDGDLRRQCEAKARSLRIADRVYFAGAGANAARFCAAFDLLLLTSRYEGLPLVILEAFAYGVPVVSTDAGGIRECVTADVGMVLPLDTSAERIAAAVVEALQRFSGDPGVKESCRQKVASTFSFERMRHQLRSGLRDLAASCDRDQRLRDYQMQLLQRPLFP
jgi:glycosyltransferase involved in cell wall biosynthesis